MSKQELDLHVIRSKKRRLHCNSIKLQESFKEKVKENGAFSYKGIFGDKEMPYSGLAGREVISFDTKKKEYYLFYTSTWNNEEFVGPKKLFLTTIKFIDVETIEYSVKLKAGFLIAYLLIYLVLVFLLYINIKDLSPFVIIPTIVLILFFRSNRKTKRNYEQEVESYLLQLSEKN